MATKNPTLHYLSIWGAALVSLTGIIFSLILYYFTKQEVQWLSLSLLWLAVFFITYLINLYLIRRFVYRKIKLIYKLIRSTKVSLKQDEINLNDHVLDEVERDVSQWISKQQDEIQELKSLEKYRRNFLGNISHELKTPIFTIQGFIHTLIEGAVEDEEVRYDYLKRAERNAHRLQAIVEDLETITGLERGAVSLDIQEFDIKEVAKEVMTDLRLLASEKNINIEFKPGAAQSFRVLADKEKIEQVLTNLITNAIKYGRGGGYVRVSFYDMMNNILVEVADDGIGMSEKHLSHVFDRFYRIDKSRNRRRGGSGLGLSIVKHIIDAHDQSISVRSTPEQGSTFGFTLEKRK